MTTTIHPRPCGLGRFFALGLLALPHVAGLQGLTVGELQAQVVGGGFGMSVISNQLRELLVLVGLGLSLWALLSVPALAAKATLDGLGLSGFATRLADLAKRVGVSGVAYSVFFERVRASYDAAGEHAALSLVLDQRHERLANRLRVTELAVKRACDELLGLEGSAGPLQISKEIRLLRDQTKVAADLGGDVDYDLHVRYGDSIRAWVNFLFVAFLATAFAVGNGVLLALFMRDLIPGRFLGVPISYFPAILIILIELGIGYGLAYAVKQKSLLMQVVLFIVLLAAAGIFGWIESVIFGVLGANMELDIPLLGSGLSQGWMAPWGVGFVLITTTMGFIAHMVWDELAGHIGATSLKREVRQVNAYVANLPERWGAIDRKAAQAAASVELFQARFVDKGGALKSAVGEIRLEGKRLLKAIAEARVDDWAQVIAAAAGDHRRLSAVSVALCLISVLALGAFSGVLGFLLAGAIAAAAPLWVFPAAALLAGLAYYSIGFLCFDRIQIAKVDGGGVARVFPLRPGVTQAAAGLIIALAISGGLIWAGTATLGNWGIVAGLALSGLGAFLAILGYSVDRAVRGGALILSVLAALAVATITSAFSVLRYLALWLAAAIVVVLTASLSILASPAEFAVRMVKGSPERTPIATGSSAEPAEPAAVVSNVAQV